MQHRVAAPQQEVDALTCLFGNRLHGPPQPAPFTSVPQLDDPLLFWCYVLEVERLGPFWRSGGSVMQLAKQLLVM